LINRFESTRPRVNIYLGIALAAIAAVVIDLYVLRQGFSYRELIVAFGVLIGAVIVLGGERGVQLGVVLWIFTLALGYRTIGITRDLRIHPAEVVLWLLMLCVLAQPNLRTKTRLSLPLWLWLLIPFWVFAWWPLVNNELPWDAMLNEFRDFLLLIPLIIVAATVLQERNRWRVLLFAFFVMGTWIAVIGMIEYHFPEIKRIFPAFMESPRQDLTPEGFVRAHFAFWGGPEATFICILTLPCALALLRWWPAWWQRGLIILASVSQVLAIYVGGYRSIWLLLVIELLLASLLRLRRQAIVIAIVCLVITVGGYQLIPEIASKRAESGIQALQGRPLDSSSIDRKNRAFGALNSVVEYPLGNGWSSAGWVHSDFIQVAANLGILAGAIFLGGYLYTLMRLGRRVLPRLRLGENGDLGLTLLLAFVGVGGLLAMEGIEVLPQLVLPAWFVWVLVEIWLRQAPAQEEFQFAAGDRYPIRTLGDRRGMNQLGRPLDFFSTTKHHV
jgi:hypothetical protein